MASHSKVFNTISIGILTTVFTGLIFFSIKFFTQVFPNIEAKIKLLEQKSQHHDKMLESIDNRTQKIYELLIEAK